VGGDTSAGPVTFLAITAIGESDGPLLLRSAGHPGDLLAVTGTLGGSRGGLRLLRSRSAAISGEGAELVRVHRRPWPRVAEGQLLARSGVRCGLDMSDGLLGDAGHICERSGVGAILRIDRVPAPKALTRLFPDEWRELALAGGEDYELLVAGPGDVLERAREELLATTGTELTVVGELVEAPATGPAVRVVDEAGRPVQSRRSSWQHFSTAQREDSTE
jgi:thiamine-monophosphate kinase